MRTISILFLLITGQLLAANPDDSMNLHKINTYEKWDIGISFSADYSYRVLSPLQAPDASSAMFYTQCADSLNSIEKPTIAWTIGIPVTYHFNKFISIKTGLYLSDKTFQSKGFVKANGVYEYWDIFKKDGMDKESFIFMELPFALQYTYRPEKFKKIRFSVFAGISLCSNISRHTYDSRAWEMDYGYQHPELESSYGKLSVDKFDLFYLGYTAGLKVTYKLSEKFVIGLEPVYKFYGKEFVSANEYSNAWSRTQLSRQIMGITEKPYSYGINLSLEFTK